MNRTCNWCRKLCSTLYPSVYPCLPFSTLLHLSTHLSTPVYPSLPISRLSSPFLYSAWSSTQKGFYTDQAGSGVCEQSGFTLFHLSTSTPLYSAWSSAQKGFYTDQAGCAVCEQSGFTLFYLSTSTSRPSWSSVIS